MMRVFKKDSKSGIETKAGLFVENLAGVESIEDFKKLHRGFCEEFTTEFKTAKYGRADGQSCNTDVPSYGQAAKVLDVVLKVYVVYSKLPNLKKSNQLKKYLYCPIDTIELQKLRPILKTKNMNVKAISQIDKKKYCAIQKIVRAELQSCEFEAKHPVDFDDQVFYLRNIGADA